MTNAELAQKLRDLRDFLIIAGYEEGHATRYGHIARAIDQMSEPVEELRRTGRLREIPGVGPTIQLYIKEILDQGWCSKQKDWESQAPVTVVELTRIPGLGPRIARDMYFGYGVDSLAKLKVAADAGVLEHFHGVSPALSEAIRAFFATK